MSTAGVSPGRKNGMNNILGLGPGARIKHRGAYGTRLRLRVLSLWLGAIRGAGLEGQGRRPAGAPRAGDQGAWAATSTGRAAGQGNHILSIHIGQGIGQGTGYRAQVTVENPENHTPKCFVIISKFRG